MEHTRGPWSAGKTWQVYDGKGRVVAYASSTTPSTMEEVDANVRLIAAAPEMLEFLLDIQKFDWRGRHDKLDAIIKKAKGE